MSEIKLKYESRVNGLYDEIKTLVIHSRNHIVTEINGALLQTYWEIGKRMVTNEQNHSERAEYGRALLKGLSKMLTKEFGRGFSVSNLQFMRRFYQDRVRTCYMQTCFLYVNGEPISNNSVRELFGIDEKDKYKASRIIKDTLEAKFIKPVDENTAPRYMKYIPFWA